MNGVLPSNWQGAVLVVVIGAAASAVVIAVGRYLWLKLSALAKLMFERIDLTYENSLIVPTLVKQVESVQSDITAIKDEQKRQADLIATEIQEPPKK